MIVRHRAESNRDRQKYTKFQDNEFMAWLNFATNSQTALVVFLVSSVM
jgi:hypothetical protein